MLKPLTLLLLSTAVSSVTVKTRYGTVTGFEAVSVTGNRADVFLSIPFAKQPIGNLRFEKPEPVDPWGHLNATSFGKTCVPHVAHAGRDFAEDCLTLNILRPQDAKNAPVLVWIHGGGFEIGSAPQHGYQAFVDNYLKEGVIVITIQYRLGFLGFYTDGTENAPGNLGLFDQTQALRFIKENIEDFGGNSNDITVWGYSAGGASVSLLSLSPYSRDLFQKSIIQSASSMVQWVTGHSAVNHSQRFAHVENSFLFFLKEQIQATGCAERDAKKCLKEKSIEELHATIDSIGSTTDHIDFLLFTPVIDGDFVPKNPYFLIDEAPRKPTLMAGLGHSNDIQSMGIKLDKVLGIDEEFVRKIINEKVLYGNQFGANTDKVLDELMKFYTRNKPEEVDTTSYLADAYSKIFSDIVFNVAMNREIKKRVQVGTDVWVYKFNRANEKIFPAGFPDYAKGSPHANEYHYMFDMPLLAEIDMTNGSDKKAKDTLIQSILSFVKNGKPTVDNLTWNRVTTESSFEHLDIDGKNSIKFGIFDEEAEFYEKLRGFGYDLIDPLLEPSNTKQEL